MEQQESFDTLEELAVGDREIVLTSAFITSEKLRTWLTTTKEGKAMSAELMTMQSQAFDLFEQSKPTDAEGLQEARMQLEVSKKVFEFFNGIFQDGEIARKQLSGETE